MITFIRWRLKKKTTLEDRDISKIRTFKTISAVQMALVLSIPFIAICMARNLKFS